MFIGDLVHCMGARDLKRSIGIIVKVKKEQGPFGMHLYEVLTGGTITTFTSAAVRSIYEVGS